MARRRDIDRLRGEIDELFADLWQIPRFAGLRTGFRPQIDCFRRDDPPSITVVVDVAGVAPDEIDVLISAQELAITGQRRRPSAQGGRYQLMEIDYGPFQRTLTLPEHVDAERAEARYERGLLVISLPLAERPARQAKIAVEVPARP